MIDLVLEVFTNNVKTNSIPYVGSLGSVCPVPGHCLLVTITYILLPHHLWSKNKVRPYSNTAKLLRQ